MSTKSFRFRRYRPNNFHHPKSDQHPINRTPEKIISNLIEQFNLWCVSLRTKATYEFDHNENAHQCKMSLPIFPNLQSIGNGAKTKKEAKANTIIAFIAHMEKRKQVGLFVPYIIPNLYRDIQVELRRVTTSTPDLNLNSNEYLLADHILPKHRAKKLDHSMRLFEKICNIRIVTLWQSTNMTFVYIVGSKDQQELIQPYANALFRPDNEQTFTYDEKLFDIFNDDKFLIDICQRLKVLCSKQLELCKLFIRGNSVNVQCCYNEFANLSLEYENQLVVENDKCPTVNNNVDNTIEQLESTTIENNDDQLPDYSVYNEDVNASMLRVLREDEEQKDTPNETNKNSPIVIEVSDDSTDSNELQVLQTIEPKKSETTTNPSVKASVRILRHIVLDGQNIARNSNDYTGSFSWFRLSNAIDYFKNRGHEHVVAFLPLHLRDFTSKHLPLNESNHERQIRDYLINSRLIAFTPSRYNNGRRLVNYDDRFILQYAADNDGIVVSNDNFRDLQHEKNFQFIINKRILPFATINDTFMPATDPLGRNGPNLDDFLSKTT